MKKFFILCSVIFCVIFFSSSVKAEPLFEGNPTIGIAEFENKAAISKEILQAGDGVKETSHTWIQDFIVTVFQRTDETKRFNVIDLKHLKKLAEIQILNNGGMVDMSNVEANTPLGKIKSIRYMIFGSLTGISTKPSGGEIDIADRGGLTHEKRTVIANVIFEIVDVKTGEVKMSFDGVGRSSVAQATLKIDAKGEEYYETDNTDSSTGTPTIEEATTVKKLQHKIKIGTGEYSLEQVQNAIRKAVIDTVRNKKYGLAAELNGTAKGGRFYK